MSVACPNAGNVGRFRGTRKGVGFRSDSAKVTQTLSENELIDLCRNLMMDHWHDPAEAGFEAGHRGALKAAVKGIGVDNVDFKVYEELGIPIINTPGMFGGEV